MRDYQTKANVGGGPDSITTTKYGAGEFNSLASENEGAVSRSGQTLAPGDGTGEDTTQLAQSLFIHSVKSTTFQAAGTVDAITLTPVSGASGVLIPGDYDNLEGARITFVPTGANTTAVTVSIGQTGGTQLGTKKLFDASGVDLTGGELGSDRIEAIYDETADGGSGAWILVPWLGGGSSSDVFATQLLHIQDQKTSGTNAGSGGASTWNVRDLNTVLTNEVTGSSLGANQITLPAGTYYTEITAPCEDTAGTQLRLRNTTDASDDLVGITMNTNITTRNGAAVPMFGRFTIAGSKVFEVQHWTTNNATNNLGVAASTGVGEVYTDVRIWKVS